MVKMLSFGKYKGQTPAAVGQSDPKYLEWLIRQEYFRTNPLYTETCAVVKQAVVDGKISITTPSASGLVANSASNSVNSQGVNNGIVSFGKYKGQPTSILYADLDYCKWLVTQQWFQRNALYGAVKNNLSECNIDTAVNSGVNIPTTRTVTFGKYKDQLLEKMLEDLPYCQWVAGKAWERPPKYFEEVVKVVKEAAQKKGEQKDEEAADNKSDDGSCDDDEPYDCDDMP